MISQKKRFIPCARLFILLFSLVTILGAAQDCDTVLTSWNKTETSLAISAALTREAGDQGGAIFVAIAGAIAYGVQVRKICARCSDFSLPSSDAAAYQDFCGPTVYGHDQTFSGLVMLPLNNDGSGVVPGTLKGAVYAHPTETRDAPTVAWQAEDSDLELFLSVVVASNGQAVLLPDYMGYGESSAVIHKGYVVKKAYQTSTIPLWFKMEQFVSQETNCATAVSDSFAGVGYSEGGYSVLAIADAMTSLGKDVIKIHSGGAPLRTSTAAILKTVENIDQGLYPLDSRHQIALFLAAYSSTYEDLANYQQGQDMLNEDSREAVVDVVFQSSPSAEVRAELPPEDPLSVADPDLMAWIRNAIAIGDENPCGSPTVGFNDRLCQAVIENDLIEMVENTSFRIDFCHSRADRIVAFENLPDLSVIEENPLLQLREATGDHNEAGSFCVVQATLWYRLPEFQSYQVTQKHSDTGCPSEVTAAPVLAPASGPPTGTPSASPPVVSDGIPSVLPSSPPSELPSMIPSDLPSASPSRLQPYGPTRAPTNLPSFTGDSTAAPSMRPSTSPVMGGMPSGAQSPDSSATAHGRDLLVLFVLAIIPIAALLA